MEDYIAIAEEQLTLWQQTGQRDQLHKGLVILTSQLQEQSQAQQRHNEIMSEIKDIKAELLVHRGRFESIDKRFESIDKRFESIDKRFDAMDKRFGDLIHHSDKRFESMDKRFESMDKRFSQTNWTIGVGFTLMVVLMTLYNFL